MADACEKAGKDEFKSNTHPCNHCDRTFESGKALGGHVSSAHVQSKKDLQGQKAKCPECVNEYGTMKGLHGHMRVHTGSTLSGRTVMKKSKTNSTGPGTCNNGLVSIGDNQSGSGRNKRTWSVTSGQGCNNTSEHVQSGSDLTLAVDVSGPMFSGHVTGDQLWNQTHESATRKLLQLASCSYSAKDKDVVNSSDRHEPANQINNLKEQREGVSSGKMIISEQHEATNGDGVGTKISTPNKFLCSVCDQKFDTYQALGGHMASHARNKKAHHVNTIDEQKDEQQKKQKRNAKSRNNSHSGSYGVTTGEGTNTDTHLYRCDLCNKTFPDNRALKTHRRHHLEKPAQVQPSHVPTSSHAAMPNACIEINGPVGDSPMSSGRESDDAPRIVFPFDLNESLESEHCG